MTDTKAITLPPLTTEQRLALLRQIFVHSEVALRGLGEAREHLVKEIGPDHQLVHSLDNVIHQTRKNAQRAAEVEMMVLEQNGTPPSLN